MDDGEMATVMVEKAKSGMKHTNKFSMFTRKNVHMPYYVKTKVLDAALVSAILYGFGAWLTMDLK